MPVYAAGPVQVLNLAPISPLAPAQFCCSVNFSPILDLSELVLKAESQYALRHTKQSLGVFPASLFCLHVYCDGSFYPAKQTRSLDVARPSRSGWAFTVLAQLTPEPDGPYEIILSSAGPLFEEVLADCNVWDMGSDVSETYAIHQAVKYILTTPYPAVVHYDNQSAGQAASGEAQLPSRTLPLARATRGLVHMAEAKTQPITFSHVKSHEGAPFNELADDLAKLAAEDKVNTGVPYTLSSEWYSQDSVVSEWAWLLQDTQFKQQALNLAIPEAPVLFLPPGQLPKHASLKEGLYMP